MKFRWLLDDGRNTNLIKEFKWQWGVKFASDSLPDSFKYMDQCDNRKEARRKKKIRQQQNWHQVQIIRKRVQVDWEVYGK